MDIITKNGKVVAVYSWTTGLVKVARPKTFASEEQILAHALYLEKHGRSEEAVDFLDRALARLSRTASCCRDSFSGHVTRCICTWCLDWRNVMKFFAKLIIVALATSFAGRYVGAGMSIIAISAAFAMFMFAQIANLNWALIRRWTRTVPYVSFAHVALVAVMAWAAYALGDSGLSVESVSNVRAFVLAAVAAEIMVFVDMIFP